MYVKPGTLEKIACVGFGLSSMSVATSGIMAFALNNEIIRAEATAEVAEHAVWAHETLDEPQPLDWQNYANERRAHAELIENSKNKMIIITGLGSVVTFSFGMAAFRRSEDDEPDVDRSIKTDQ